MLELQIGFYEYAGSFEKTRMFGSSPIFASVIGITVNKVYLFKYDPVFVIDLVYIHQHGLIVQQHPLKYFIFTFPKQDWIILKKCASLTLNESSPKTFGEPTQNSR